MLTARLRSAVTEAIDPDTRHVAAGSLWSAAQLAVAGVGGLLFWLVAARLYTSDDVGRASALFSLMMALTYATSLGLPYVVARFSTDESIGSGAVFTWAMLWTTVSSVVGTMVLVLSAPGLIERQLGGASLVRGSIALGVAVEAFSVATLIDHRALARRRGDRVLWRTSAATGLRVPALFVGFGPRPLSIFIAATGAIAVTTAASLIHSRELLGPYRLSPRPGATTGIVRFSLANFFSQIASQLPFIALPVIVLNRVTASENAAFFVAWSFATILFTLPAVIARGLLVEGGRNGVTVAHQVRFAARLAAAASVGSLALSVPGAFLLTLLFGEQYRAASWLLVGLLAALPAYALTTVAITEARVLRDNQTTMALGLMLTTFTLVPAIASSGESGAGGAVRGWVLGQLLTGAVAVLALVRTGSLSARSTALIRLEPDEATARMASCLVAAGGAYLMAGTVGALVAVGVVVAGLMGMTRLPLVIAALLGLLSALATLLEAPLQPALSFAVRRPIASATANELAVLVFATAVVGITDSIARHRRAPRPPQSDASRLDPDARRPRIRSLKERVDAGVFVTTLAVTAALRPVPLGGTEEVLVRSLEMGAGFSSQARPSTPPLAPLVVALAPVSGGVLMALMMAITATCLFNVLRTRGSVRAAVLLTALFVVVSLAVGLTLDELLGVAAITALLAVMMAGSDSWVLGGACAGLAVLARPEASVVVLLIVAMSIRRYGVLSARVFLVALVVVAPWQRSLIGHGGGPAIGVFQIAALAACALPVVAIGATMVVGHKGQPYRLAKYPKKNAL